MREITLRPLTDEERALITATIELFSDPEKWTWDIMARNLDGKGVPVDSDKAVCWCVAGGLAKIGVEHGLGQLAGDEMVGRLGPLVQFARPFAYYPSSGEYIHSIVGLNDNVGREAVLDVLTYALKHGVPQ